MITDDIHWHWSRIDNAEIEWATLVEPQKVRCVIDDYHMFFC